MGLQIDGPGIESRKALINPATNLIGNMTIPPLKTTGFLFVLFLLLGQGRVLPDRRMHLSHFIR
jgi:hypothetical protein